MNKTYWRTQFTCLKHLICDPRIPLDPVVVEDAHSAWATLSQACHHHEYELAPSISDIHLWIDKVERFAESIYKVYNTSIVE